MPGRPRINIALVAAPALLLALGGCASISKTFARLTGRTPVQAVEIKAALASTPTAPTPSSADRLYAKATEAIRARRYSEALELLQYARQASPEDARVLNAFGVVYDKMGRFDLSARYYGLALKADPASTVVAANMRYSDALQSALRAPAPSATPDQRMLAALNPAPTPAPFVVAAAAVAPRRAEPLFTGSGMVVVNATGRAAGAEPARQFLAQAGWTVRNGQAAPQAHSEIRYAAEYAPVAHALARTLPFQIRLADCRSACAGVQLVLGRDAPAAFGAAARERS